MYLYLITHTEAGKKIIFSCNSLPEKESLAVANSLLLSEDQEILWSTEELSFRDVLAWEKRGD